MRIDFQRDREGVLHIADPLQREAYRLLTGRDYIQYHDIQRLRSLCGAEMANIQEVLPVRNTMSLKNIKKMLSSAKKAFSQEGIKAQKIDKALQAQSYEEIINILENDHLLLYIQLNGLYDNVHSVVITEQIQLRRNINGNISHCYIKVYTIHDEELVNITKETAYALGYSLVNLPHHSKTGYVEQFVLDYQEDNMDERTLAQKLANLLYNGSIQLTSRSI